LVTSEIGQKGGGHLAKMILAGDDAPHHAVSPSLADPFAHLIPYQPSRRRTPPDAFTCSEVSPAPNLTLMRLNPGSAKAIMAFRRFEWIDYALR
jgi:hypothetical protein